MKLNVNEPPEAISSLSERCVAHVKGRLGFELDYHQDTLGVVDHAIDAILQEEGEGTKPPVGHKRRAHLVHLLAPTFGAYFGEVLRRSFPCRWRKLSEEPAGWVLEFEQVYLRFSPVGAAAEAINGAAIESWDGAIVPAPSEAEVLIERLKVSPPVFEDQFYALTTRFEALQISHEYLFERRQKENDSVFDLSEENYDEVYPTVED